MKKSTMKWYAFGVLCLMFFAGYYVLHAVKAGAPWAAAVPFAARAPREIPLRVTFLDIGQGDATFAEFPDGTQMLIDCSIDARILEALGRVMDFHDRSIDYMVVTHPDADHYGGCVDVMKRFEIKTIVYNGLEKLDDPFWNSFMSQIRTEEAGGASYIKVSEQKTWYIAGAEVRVIFPHVDMLKTSSLPGMNIISPNNSSIIIRIAYGQTDMLLTADAEFELEQFLLSFIPDALDVEILKVGHHGSDTSSSQPFLNGVSPKHAVISSGIENKYGHPSRRVIKRFERMGVTVWRTDTQGDILASLYPNYYEIRADDI